MLTMKPHDSERSRKTWDIVDDVFDLGLVLYVAVWVMTGMHFDEDLLKTVALTGASVRLASRRIFRAVLGPRINAWVIRQQVVIKPEVEMHVPEVEVPKPEAGTPKQE